MTYSHWQNGRKIQKKVILHGRLELLTPAHFGAESSDTLADMAVRLDEFGRLVLPGSTIAGALRHHLREREFGYRQKPSRVTEQNSLYYRLFGGIGDGDEGDQSALIVDDASGTAAGIEFRNGVKIDADSRTAKSNHLFNLELLEAGTTFDLWFELNLSGTDNDKKLIEGLVLVLDALEKGEIEIGIRKSRGFGQSRVDQWDGWVFNLTSWSGLERYLEFDHQRNGDPEKKGKINSSEMVGLIDPQGLCQLDRLVDKRSWYTIDGVFEIDGSLLIGSQIGPEWSPAFLPESIHIHSSRGQGRQREAVLPGTSLAGVLRQRAYKIANTLSEEKDMARELVEGLFGSETVEEDQSHYASKLKVKETVIANPQLLVQYRNAIDRFTGGTADGALFDQAALFGTPQTKVYIALKLIDPADHEVGLLLNVFKDLWLGDVTVGSGAGIGRGRLSGQKIELVKFTDGKMEDRWDLSRSGDAVKIDGGKPERLQEYVDAFLNKLKDVPKEKGT